MANNTIKLVLRKQIDGVLKDLFVKTNSDQVIIDESGKTLATRLTEIATELSKKVASEEGKGLSTEDFTTELKTKLDNLLDKDALDKVISDINDKISANTQSLTRLNGTDAEEGSVAYQISEAIKKIDLSQVTVNKSDITAIKDKLGSTDISSIADGTITGVASAAYNIAKGKNQAHVFDTVNAMNEWLTVEDNTNTLSVGDNLYIRAVDVPDYWWDGTAAQKLETQKVDLTDVDNKIKANTDAIAAINNESTGAVATAKAYADTQDAATLAAAKEYTDGFTPVYISETEPTDWTKVGVWGQIVTSSN